MSLLSTLIIHVKGANERKTQMLDLLKNHIFLKYQFIEDGNIEDLTDSILTQYFKGRMLQKEAFVSCAYKHLLALEKIVDSETRLALILEDDIFFYSHFNTNLNHVLDEIKDKSMTNFVISLEDSVPKYIPKSERIEGTYLYKRNELRAAGAYLIDHVAANNILKFINTNKSDQNADWLFNSLAEQNVLNCFWAQPAIACQKSLNGNMPSLIDNKKTGWFRQLNFRIQKAIKRIKSDFR